MSYQTYKHFVNTVGISYATAAAIDSNVPIPQIQMWNLQMMKGKA